MSFAELFVSSTTEMFQSGAPLMNRVLPDNGTAETWEHYPTDDVVNGPYQCRYFYHAHPPEERDSDEHGHFHLFFGKSLFAGDQQPLRSPLPLDEGEKRADVVHLAGLSMGYDGLPLRWFTTNRWVTDEWLYPARDIIAELPNFDLRGKNGHPLVNDWLTAIFQLSQSTIADLLAERDRQLEILDKTGEDRAVEIASASPISLDELLA